MDASEAVADLQVNSFFSLFWDAYISIGSLAFLEHYVSDCYNYYYAFRKRQNASNHYLSGGSHQFNGLCGSRVPRAQLTLTCGGLPLEGQRVDIRGGANLTIASQWTDKNGYVDVGNNTVGDIHSYVYIVHTCNVPAGNCDACKFDQELNGNKIYNETIALDGLRCNCFKFADPNHGNSTGEAE
uniref:Uncharacterized protein n=1 Tax=Ditylenchus dipsaci TaxID=166011 RepID=A0A915DT40_9BILA